MASVSVHTSTVYGVAVHSPMIRGLKGVAYQDAAMHRVGLQSTPR